LDANVVRLNYVSHAIDDLRKMIKEIGVQGSPIQKEARPVLQLTIGLLQKSEKFLMPPDGLLLDFNDVQEKYRDLIRLPFPIVALEFPTTPTRNGGSTKGIVLAWSGGLHLSPDNLSDFDAFEKKEVIAFTNFFYSERQKCWQPSPYVFWFHKDHLSIENKKISKGFALSEMYGGLFSEMIEEMPLSRREFEEDMNLKFGMDALLEFVVTVNCENVVQETLLPSNVLNKKRVANAKEPFFSCKVLTIPGGNFDESNGDGSHASPRIHLRRGHIRRLATGKVTWVKHTIVGSAERGVVDKTYNVSL
jgi:hypothetical protein